LTQPDQPDVIPYVAGRLVDISADRPSKTCEDSLLIEMCFRAPV
jgi:hypothetical protein